MKLKHAQKVNALLAAMVLVGGTALAADNTTTATTAEAAYTLPNVVVTATRTPESTLTVPANVSVVTGKQLQPTVLQIIGVLKLIDQHVFDRVGRDNPRLHQTQ